MWNELLEISSTDMLVRDRLGNAQVTGLWDKAETPEPKIHRIHGYPAKFPAFLATRALSYASDHGVDVQRVADIFCGCGTVAYEAQREGIDFWGCDLNPVATLIATVKSTAYKPDRLRSYMEAILSAYPSSSCETELSEQAIARLAYWYPSEQFASLAKLLNSIRATVPARSSYLAAFLCAFSAILKQASLWHQRSIKPHFDRNKNPRSCIALFRDQCELMITAWSESPSWCSTRNEIHWSNVMTIAAPMGGVDMIVTSPPYVTSYEYADLHQLSSLWLGFASDHRELRTGSIGSSQHKLNFRREFKRLNRIGRQVVFSLYDRDLATCRSVASYFLDMQVVAARCHAFLRANGIAFFVIGNTDYHGQCVDNSSHLTEALLDAGFARVRVAKRRISNKMHTPFRGDDGRFSSRFTKRETYSEEYIVIGHK
jgi:methylase of polypeptide subunit release factors